MKLAVEIHQALTCADRFSAVLVIDGTPTTFECSHLHHSRKAAQKCLLPLLERAEDLTNDPTFTVTEIDTSKYGQAPGLVEWAVTRMSEPGRFNLAVRPQLCTTRLHMHRNVL